MRRIKTEMINEHDMTKKMMSTIRGLNENDANNRTKDLKQGDADFEAVAKGLREIDPSARIKGFKVYVQANPAPYAELNFTISSGFEFNCTTKSDREFSVSIPASSGETPSIYLDETLLSNIGKLRGYYVNWYNDWSEKMATDSEYKIV